MRITVIQMSPGHVMSDNIEAAERLIRRAVGQDGPDMVVLPEMWSCLGGDVATRRRAAEKLPGEGNTARGPLYDFLASLAREAGVIVHGGSIAEFAGGRLHNTTLVFDRDGTELARYRKIHLFDVVTPNGQRYCESDLYEPGRDVTVFKAGETPVGCAICYDLRFGYLFDALRDAGAELILIPAAFTAETGRAHWEILVRGRAIETQCWIAASATTGNFVGEDGKSRSTFGQSMICDPWGRIVALVPEGPGWATATVDRGVTSEVRQRMPIWRHRRMDSLVPSSSVTLMPQGT